MAVGICSSHVVVVAAPSLSSRKRFLLLNLRSSSSVSSLAFFPCKRRVFLPRAGEDLLLAASSPWRVWRLSLRSRRSGSRERGLNGFGSGTSTRAYGSGESSGTGSVVDVEKFPALTLYEMLGISEQVGLPEIKTAYRQMARRYHPDANPPSKRDECTEKFLRVQEAYEVLADPALRADYDFRLRNPLSVQALASGFAYKSHDRRSGKGRRNSAVEEEVDKEEWKSQWQTQVDGLRMGLGRKKAGSWAARMQQKREESASQ